MTGKFSLDELAEGCRRYLKLSDLEQETSDLFEYWSYLFFEMATKPSCAADVWKVIGSIVDTDLSAAQLAFIAAGPFEEMLVSLKEPTPGLFPITDLPKVRSLVPFVWRGRIREDVYRWICVL